MPYSSDVELVRRYLSHQDQAAMSEIYEQNLKPVYAFVYARTGKRELTEDVVSETFLTLISILSKYNGQSSLKSFIIGVAVNKLRQSFDQKPNIQELTEELIIVDEPATVTDEDIHKEEELAKLLHQVLANLPDNYRAVLTLRFVQGQSIKQTASHLQLTEANVRVIQSRAVQKAKLFAQQLINPVYVQTT
jgi:RNA polymerase sigma-70 factor (ECF subfamily)